MLGIVFVTSAILIAQGSTQSNVTCYTDNTCQGGAGDIVASAEECCVGGDGIAFQGDGNQPCQECVVFGWLRMGSVARDGFEGREQAGSYFLRVGFIKGSRFNATQLQIGVIDAPQTAGPNDYSFNNSVILSISQPLPVLGVDIVLLEDGIAMEPRETFQLQLIPQDALLANEFLADTLDITIRDSDRVSFQFSSSSYSTVEGSDLPIVIQRYGQIATPVTLRVDTMNLTALDNDATLDVPPFDPLQPNIASSYPQSSEDFRSTTVLVIFEADEHFNSTAEINVSTIDDNVNEADQYFAVLLGVMNAVNLNRVDLTTGDISTCMIEDDDSVRIRFRRRDYTTDEVGPNEVLLERTVPSEQTFMVRINAGSDCNPPTVGPTMTAGPNDPIIAAEPSGVDYSVHNELLLFTPEMVNAVFPLSINDDTIWETMEVFDICFSRAPTSAFFDSMMNGRNAKVKIEDNDIVTVGFVETEYNVLASEATINVTVMISEGDVEPCIQLDIQTGDKLYPLRICDLNVVSVEINISGGLDDDQLPNTFQAELRLDDSRIPQEMAARVVVSPSRTTITVVESQSESSSGDDVPLVSWIVPVCVVLLLLLLVVIVGGVCILRQRRKKVQSKEIRRQSSEIPYWTATNGLQNQGCSSHDYTELKDLKLVPKGMSISSRQLKLMDTIGEGEFGMVYRARLECQSGVEQVAVKTLRGIFTPNDVRNMLKEVEKMQDLDHVNVMSLKGVCLDGGSGPIIVMPYMARGSLLHYLRKERKKLVVPDAVEKDKKLLLDMCLQIAKGMQYLTKKKIVHRDLAARNCMINVDGVVKVADFGLSEDIYTQNYFRQDKSQTEVKLPVRWMAPESIEDLVFTEKTDVWSYGVTMWEIYTGGTVPYGGIGPTVILQLLKSGERLPKPTNAACDDDIFPVMLDCWKETPTERPDFSELVITISTLLEAIAGYLSLSVSQCSNRSSDDDIDSTSNKSVRIEIKDNA